MRVLHIAPQDKSGIAKYADNFRKAASRHGGIEYILLPERLHRRIRSVSAFRRLGAEIRGWCGEHAGAVDVVHVELGWFTTPELYIALFIGANCPDLPLVALVHDPPRIVSRSMEFLGLDRLWVPGVALRKVLDLVIGNRAITGRVLKHAALAVTLSRAGKRVLESTWDLPEDRVEYLPHIDFDLSKYVRRGGKTAARGVEEKRQLLFFGGLHPSKGIDLLLHSLAELRRAGGPPFRLHICGPDLGRLRFFRYRPVVERLVRRLGLQDGVTIHGYMEWEEMERLVAECSIAVLPYKEMPKVAMSGAMLFAMSRGLVPVASKTGTFGEVIEHGKNGYQLADRDPKLWSRYLSRLMSDYDEYDRLRQGALRTIGRFFSPEVVAARTQEIYQRTLGWKGEGSKP